MEKEMAPDSSTLAWKIPWMEEPSRLQFVGSLRVGHDWVTSLSLFTFTHWRRKWHPTPVFLPGEFQGQGSLVGWSLWGRAESYTPEATQQQFYKCPTFYSMHSLLDSLVSSYFCTLLKQRKDIISLYCFHCSCHFCSLEF